METIYNWTARRAGGRITINGTTADTTESPPRKVPNVDVIKPDGARIVAIDKNGVTYRLAASASVTPRSPAFEGRPTVHVVASQAERDTFERRLRSEGKSNYRIISAALPLDEFRERCMGLEPGDIHVWAPIDPTREQELRYRQRHGGEFIFH
jgi:hypothetical protein